MSGWETDGLDELYLPELKFFVQRCFPSRRQQAGKDDCSDANNGATLGNPIRSANKMAETILTKGSRNDESLA